MSTPKLEVRVRCWNPECGKDFPVLAVRDDEELQRVVAFMKKGGEGTVRVARWCPWCTSAVMVSLPLRRVPRERYTFMREGQEARIAFELRVASDAMLQGEEPKPGEDERHDRAQ